MRRSARTSSLQLSSRGNGSEDGIGVGGFLSASGPFLWATTRRTSSSQSWSASPSRVTTTLRMSAGPLPLFDTVMWTSSSEWPVENQTIG